MSNQSLIKETITPQRARHLLSALPDNQRSISKRIVAKYKASIVSGEWVPYFGEAFCLTPSGQLINGQHRCIAVIAANKSIDVYVRHGCSLNDIFYLDQGKPRSLADILKINGYINSGLLAATLSLLWQYQQGSFSGIWTNFSAKTALNLLKTYPRINQSMSKTFLTNNALTPSITSFLHFAYSKSYPSEIANAIQELKTGLQCCNSNAVIKLREQLIASKLKHYSLNKSYKVAIAIKAFNAYIQNGNIKQLRYMQNETFPSIICDEDFINE